MFSSPIDLKLHCEQTLEEEFHFSMQLVFGWRVNNISQEVVSLQIINRIARNTLKFQ